VATHYTNSIVTYCESLQALPLRGIQRDDIRPGLRITSYRKRFVITFEVQGIKKNPSCRIETYAMISLVAAPSGQR
jgi:plasmid stabilization system protein ParE